MLGKFKNFRITTKFIAWFLFIALVPLAIATYISYNSSRKVLEDEVAKGLLAVADNKAHQIKVYLRERENNATDLSHKSEVIVAIESYNDAFNKTGIDSHEYKAIDQEFRPFFSYYEKSLDYGDLFLINPEGYIVFSVKQREPRSLYEIALYEDSQLANVFIKTKGSLKTEVSDFEHDRDTKESALFIAAPIFKGADLIGIVTLQMSNRGIYEFVKDYTGLGKTGETIMASKMGDEVVFIAPLRFDPNAEFTRKVTIGSRDALDVQKAVQGEEGLGVFVDYRGKEVLAARRYLPSFRWGVIVKMDTAEIFSSAERLRNTLLKVSLVLLAAVMIMAVVIARSVSSPIKNLTDVSGTITGGNLSARAKIHAKDEIGELAQSFNKMTDSLVEAKANVEQKKAELEEQKKLLEKANKELDSFVYTASHDLRAPLRGISSFASFLEEDYKEKLDKEGKSHLKEIRDGASRMNELIEDLLKLSRISRIKNPYEDVQINTLIDSVIKRIEFDIKEKKVDLKIQQDMPTVRCDRIKMNEVFLNLINNAIKFSSKDNKEGPRVEIGYADEGESHKFYVKDNGIGIAPEYHQKIFDIFQRLHTADEYEGTGAGLSIVKRIIDDHDGDIWIESEVGKGAAFYFTIPKGLKKKKKIGEILVEDGVISEEALKEKLKKQGIEEAKPETSEDKRGA
jgi:signal transduction histidine kinase